MNPVIYANRFLKATGELAPKDRKLVDNAVMEFARGSQSKGLRLHKLNFREKRFHSISASDDLRIIILIDVDNRVVMHADHHDAAYRWAERHRVRNHEITGVPQIIEFVESVEQRVQFNYAEPANATLFHSLTDKALAKLGVPAEYIGLVRKVQHEDDLVRLGTVLPEEAWEALVEVANGADPDIIAAEYLNYSTAVINDQVAESTPGNSYTTQAARRRFWVADSEQSLSQALDLPWAAWRVFLHPSQAAAVAADHAGPARITGGAGTGKTIVLIHRAVRLLREKPESRLLLSTFSRFLARQLVQSVNELVGEDMSILKRIDITPLHEHALRTLHRVEPSCSLASKSEQKERLVAAVEQCSYLARPLTFVLEEWHNVIDYWGVQSLPSYLAVSRKGRGRSLSPTQRELLWPVFEQVLDSLHRDHKLTRAGICQRASELATDLTDHHDHVLVDEAQDFGPREIRYAHSRQHGLANGFYLGMDDGQRIFSNAFPLTAVGINIRGRSRRLQVNYRTSAEIHDFAIEVLPDEAVDNDPAKSRRVTSLFGGVMPEIERCESHLDEAKHIADWIENCRHSGIPVSEIALLSRQMARLQNVLEYLEREASLPAVRLVGHKGRNLIADTLHAAKGLEFRAVAIVGAEEGTLPLLDAMEGEPGDEAYALSVARERHLLYVGCTRPREALMVTYVGSRSRFLPATNRNTNR